MGRKPVSYTHLDVYKRQDLLLRVHDEGAIADDGLIQRFAAEHQKCGIVIGLDAEVLAGPIQHRHLRVAQNLAVVELHGSAQYHNRERVARRDAESRALAGVQTHIPDIQRREGVRLSLIHI